MPPPAPPRDGRLTTKRTLEWACAAAARSRGEEGGTSGARSVDRDALLREEEEEETDVDSDQDEAVTPGSSFGAADLRWSGAGDKGQSVMTGVEDQDVMRAALLLCKLGRR
jgi:hypothetical protein